MKALEKDLVLYWWFTIEHRQHGCKAFIESTIDLMNAYEPGTKEYCAIKTLREVAFHKGQIFRMLDNQQEFFKVDL